MPIHIGFDDETIRIKPYEYSKSTDINDKLFAVYDLGPFGDLINEELMRP